MTNPFMISVCEEMQYENSDEDGDNDAAQAVSTISKAETKATQKLCRDQPHHVKCNCQEIVTM